MSEFSLGKNRTTKQKMKKGSLQNYPVLSLRWTIIASLLMCGLPEGTKGQKMECIAGTDHCI